MNTLLSVNQVAYMLKVHPLTIRRYIAAGKLKAVKLGGNVRIEEAALANLQKDVQPTPLTHTAIIQRVRKTIARPFDQNDPFLRLKGRGASL